MKLIIQAGMLLTACAFSSHTVFAGCLAPNADVISNNPDSIYTDNGDGTVTDNNTGLMWQKCTLGLSGTACDVGRITTFAWDGALAAANANTDSTYSDWRLPNKNELESLVDYGCKFQPINSTIFPASATSGYWSSTPYTGNGELIWISSYSTGGGIMYAVNSAKDRPSFAVRLVRGLQ